MKTLHLKVGEHVLHIQSEYDDMLDTIGRDYARFVQPVGPIKPNILISIQPGPGVPTTDFHVEIKTTSEFIMYERSDYRLEVNHEYTCARISVLNEWALKHALMNLYSAFIVHHEWGLLIHSSCIEDTGKSYLFAGPSGAGKSTVAKLSAPRPVLSDEASIVKIHGDDIKVFPSPFHSELKTTYPDESCKLSAIYLLIQSLHVKTEPLKKADSIIRILDKVFFWPHDRMETMKAMMLCKQLANRVPAYHLYFQKNNHFWELIS